MYKNKRGLYIQKCSLGYNNVFIVKWRKKNKQCGGVGMVVCYEHRPEHAEAYRTPVSTQENKCTLWELFCWWWKLQFPQRYWSKRLENKI